MQKNWFILLKEFTYIPYLFVVLIKKRVFFIQGPLWISADLSKGFSKMAMGNVRPREFWILPDDWFGHIWKYPLQTCGGCY